MRGTGRPAASGKGTGWPAGQVGEWDGRPVVTGIQATAVMLHGSPVTLIFRATWAWGRVMSTPKSMLNLPVVLALKLEVSDAARAARAARAERTV